MPRKDRITPYYRETCLHIRDNTPEKEKDYENDMYEILKKINLKASKYGVFDEKPMIYHTFDCILYVVWVKLTGPEGQGFGADFFTKKK